MLTAQVTANEEERLAALQHYQILDTADEPSFDDLAKLAATICATPVAFVSLIGRDRQWLKSCIGPDLRSIPRAISLCGHAIQQREVMEIADARLDPRFASNPLVVGPLELVFYAGVPLITPDGHAIGTVCVADRVPRVLTPEQRTTLEILARQAINLMELRLSAHELQTTQFKLQEAYDYAPIGMVELNHELRFMAVNPAFSAMLEYSREELVGRTTFEFTHPDDLQTSQARRESINATADSSRLEKRFVTKSGRVLWVSVTTTHMLNGADGKPRLYCCVEDISQLKDVNLQLIQSRKMAALGEMASGISHEINNPLAIIVAAVSQMRRNLSSATPDPQKALTKVAMIEVTVQRMAKIIKGLRSFARDSSGDAKEIALVRDLIDETLELCRERFNASGVTVKTLYTGDAAIMCRPAQIDQIMMNLLTNAYDAMGGKEGWVEVDVAIDQDRATISVTDSGKGVLPEHVDKLMQPFFTTKDVGQGTGLGLSICKGIAEEHEGRLYYDRTSARTRFVLVLPLASSLIRKNAA